ncbi:MAG: integrase arm-type DNA-binding domain-containing protein [Burkholderiaceae bacterium]|nr:integrase arm-type DNA-binding domain-containing protein [Aquabacterium sp.]NUP85130.1 integrase arm-type DNA-binding domain-containing protein [Burkholderiaceae bacterium]
MATDTLTDTAIRKAKPGDKARKMFDGGGLYLELQPSGARWWRLKYRLAGKEKRLSLGVYPAVSLAEARRRREEARELVAQGVDPSEPRKAEKAEQQRERENMRRAAEGLPAIGSFEQVAREWLVQVHEPKVSAGYAKRSRIQLEGDVFPWIGAHPVASITAPMVLELLRKVEARGAQDTAHRVKQTCGLVFRYAIATGHAERDPIPDLREALAHPVKRHYAAMADPVKLGELMRAIEGYGGHPATRTALKVAAMVFQRPGNVLAMRWADLELDAGVWTIPAADMKRTKQGKATGADHVVPLATQAVQALRELQPLTGAGVYCFPNQRTRGRPISNVTMNAAMRRMGFGPDEITAHGFRSTARTIIAEQLPQIDVEWIEAQLAHSKGGPLGMAYDRAQYLAQRRQMMQVWADYLDRLMRGADVLTLPARSA